ncbi:MAG: hypothetical protein IIB59_04305 [Planctomycetes bacterium]|nr:hypothetical protein [Planctomycetota bacterium]
MALKQDTTLRRSSGAASVLRTQATPSADRPQSPLLDDVTATLRGDVARFVAVAPGRLDVMGGLAEYTGALVLNVPLGQHACVAVQRRADEVLSITCSSAPGENGDMPTEIALSKLFPEAGKVIDPENGLALPAGDSSRSGRCVLGALLEAVRAGLLPSFSGGLSIAYALTADLTPVAGGAAALSAATLVAAAGALDVPLDAREAAQVCQQMENAWLGLPVGVADAVCSLVGAPQSLNQVRCDPCNPAGSLALPDNLLLIGVDCGAVRKDSAAKYADVRVATFMGRLLIDRIIRHDELNHIQWDGYLSRLSITDYVERFRDRIPTKFKGQEFLDRFGETSDPLTRVDPNMVYKIRSRTEHHIYEHSRSCQFVECISRAIRSGDDRAIAEAGELMYASHWSYGQRCGLGSVETDLMLNLIRKQGVAADIYGAKVTGRGGGGIVAVLMKGGDRAETAVRETIKKYNAQSGHAATLLNGSSPGCLFTGALSL